MSPHSKSSAPRPPKNIKVDVINPNYEGATFEMVVKAMLQRPKKTETPAEKMIPKAARINRRAGIKRSD